MHFIHSHQRSYFTVYREGEWKLIYYYNSEHPERPDCVLYTQSPPLRSVKIAPRATLSAHSDDRAARCTEGLLPSGYRCS